MFGRNNRIKSLEAALKKAQGQKHTLENELLATRQRLEDAESLLRDREKYIQNITNASNARLSLILGLKRYLDSHFQSQEEPVACPNQTTKSPEDASDSSSDS